MKFPSKKHLIIGAIVLVVGFIIFSATRPNTITYETEAVSRGDVIHEVTVTGSVAPFKKIALQPEVSGKVSKVHVTEGAEVKAGQVLVEIDARDINARIASQRAAADSARARLAELVAGATPGELALSEAAVATARSKRDAAVSAYNNVVANANAQMSAKLDSFLLAYDDALTAAKDAVERLSGPMFTSNDFLTFSTINATAESAAVSSRGTAKLKLIDLTSVVASVKADGTASMALSMHATAAADLSAVKIHLEADRTVLGYTTGLSSTTLATYQANVSAALSAVDGALQSLSLAKSAVDLQARLNAGEVSSATFGIDAAKNALAQAEADLAIRISGNRAEVVAAQRANVAAQDATLSGLYADLAKRQIVAPLDATVTEVSVSVGETAQPGKAAVELNAHGNFEIVANISEVDISRIKTGQIVDITLDAFAASEHWSGKVGFIDPAEKVIEGVIFYETKFMFDQEDERVRSGMTANLSIETARRDNALRVPVQALKERQGKTYVDVLVNGAQEEREISVGVENDEYSEVLSGLSEGELVVTGSSEDK